MKKIFSTLFMAAGLLTATLLNSCSSDDDTNNNGGVTATKEYKLYNYSNPSGPLEAGTVVFSQLADSTASAQVTLNSGFRQSGTTYTANIITTGSSNGVYSNLTSVDGSVGTSTTSPVRQAIDNTTIKYRTLVSQTGYQVRVLAGSVLQGSATIQ